MPTILERQEVHDAFGLMVLVTKRIATGFSPRRLCCVCPGVSKTRRGLTVLAPRTLPKF